LVIWAVDFLTAVVVLVYEFFDFLTHDSLILAKSVPRHTKQP
jgi:hypothetical protein